MSINVVVLTGAGISAESGLGTFRAADGLWEEHRIEDVATPEAFARNPDWVHDFYNARRRQLRSVEPNAAHLALAAFEKEHDGDFLLITQNVDDLHERAGSRQLAHMHGDLLSMRCLACDTVLKIQEDLSVAAVCQSCHQSGVLRPDIVWFGEMPYRLPQIHDSLSCCGLFISIGTSGNVYPAAGFVQTAKAVGARCVELNLEKTSGEHFFDDSQYGPASKTVPDFFASLY